jgi:hypothetical protein
MNCECRKCRNEATWYRPQAIQGCANALCNGCMIRIYHGFPHHSTAWEKIQPLNPSNPPEQTHQPTLF